MTATSRLSSLLVRDSIVPVKRMETAFQRQVIYGGGLDTILLEMNAVDEGQLTDYLALASGLPPAEPELFEYFDPRAVQVCPREVAEAFHVAPVSVEDEALRVLVTDPVDLARLEEMATRLGVPVQPFVVPEYRFHLLVERLFGIPVPSRFAALARKRGTTGPTARHLGDADMPKVIVEDMPVEEPAIELTHQTTRTPTAEFSPGAVREREKRRSQSIESEETPVDRPSPVGTEPVPREPSDASAVVQAPWRGGDTIDPTPLEPRQAPERLARAEGRDAIFATLVRAVRSRARYVALLTVQGGAAFGRVAIDGKEPDSFHVTQVSIPLDQLPAFRNAVDSASPYIGPVKSNIAEADSLLAQLGGVVPPTALILPVAIRGRVVALVYAHRGADVLSPVEVSDVLPLAGDAAMALSKLILKAKAEGFRKPAPTDARVEPTLEEIERKKAPPRGDKDGKWSASAPVSSRPIAHVLDVVEAGDEPAASQGVEEVLQRADEALPELDKRFPGKLRVDRYQTGGRTRPASEHGPLLAILVKLGSRAAPLLVEHMASRDREARYYATLAAGEVRSSATLPALLERLFDSDYGVRSAAIEALLGYPARDVDAALDPVRKALHAEPERAAHAAAALGELRDVKSIPELIEILGGEHEVAEEARRALVQLTKQDFGARVRKWRSWWQKNRTRSRVEWMLDGLSHSHEAVRMSASEELKRLTGEYFGYHYDLPKREREDARKRWIKWWETTGRSRFLRPNVDESTRSTGVLPSRRD